MLKVINVKLYLETFSNHQEHCLSESMVLQLVRLGNINCFSKHQLLVMECSFAYEDQVVHTKKTTELFQSGNQSIY